jgi:hypothetical protein
MLKPKMTGLIPFLKLNRFQPDSLVETPATEMTMFWLTQIKESALRFLGIIHLTPEQEKLLDEMDDFYERILGTKNTENRKRHSEN